MPQSGQTQRRDKESCYVNAMLLFLVFLYWQGVNTETTFSPVTDDAITSRRTIVHKGQSHVTVQELEILKPQNIELLCNLTDIPSQHSNITGFWRKDEDEIENSQQSIYRHNEHYILKKIFNIQASDLGNYSCIFSYVGKELQATFVLKVPAIKDKRDRPIVSYVGDTVVLDCGIKRIPNTWEWYKTNGSEKELINATADPMNYKILLAKNITKLTLMNLTQEDSGKYTCSAIFDIKPSESQLILKVLSFSEPLKPFVAIAVEVAILVTLILLYERYSQKKKGPAGTTENGLYEHTPMQEENTLEDEETTTRQRKVEN
ncbi:embigin [Tachysurus vachellii]|uniref:embigin n=1 Tax=Tachysurus vachellii TaxID=175792 RepID=UPI00296B324E|nr:embigin [Tachysurus vachellii]